MSKCYIDSNVLICFKFAPLKQHKKAKKTIKYLRPDKYRLYISPLTIDEFIHSFNYLLKRYGYSTQNIPALLKEALDSILSFNHLEIVNPPTEKSKNKKILKLMKDFKLRPRDAYHLLIMKENNIKEFATFDIDFKNVFRSKRLKKLA